MKIGTGLLLAFLLLVSFPAIAQWQQLNGPFDGKVNCVNKMGSRYLAGTENGMYYSLNEGANWLSTTRQSMPVHSILSFGDTIALLKSDPITLSNRKAYFQMSIDNGQTWLDSVQLFLFGFGSNTSGPVLTKVGNALVVRNDSNKGYYSLDFFQSFQAVPSNDSINNPSPYIFSLSTDGNKIAYSFEDDYTFPTDNYLINYSLDGMNTFNELCDSCMYPVVVGNSVIITSFDATGSQLLVSHDWGQTWDSIPGLPHFNSVSYSVRIFNHKIYAKATVYPGPSLIEYMSTDSGHTWVPSDNQLIIVDVVPITNGFIGFRPYAWLTMNLLDQSYQYIGDRMNGMIAGSYTRMRASANNLYAYNWDSFFKSSDLGVTWNKFPHIGSIFGIQEYGDSLFVYRASSNHLLRSYSAGSTWDSIPFPLTTSSGSGGTTLSFIVENGNYYFSNRTSNPMFWSSDLGQTWDTLPNPSGYPAGQLYGFLNRIFLRSGSDLFLLSPNLQWTLLANNIKELYQIDNQLIYYRNSGINNVYFTSSDTGTTWLQLPMNGLPSGFFSDFVSHNSYWFATKCGTGIYASADNGNNWSVLIGGNGVPFAAGNDLLVHNGELYAASGSSGIWKFSGSQFTLVSGNIYYDLNLNNQRDLGELPANNVMVELLDQQIQTYSTMSGNYSFFSISTADSIRCFSTNSMVNYAPSIQNFVTSGGNYDFALQFDSNAIDASVFGPTPFISPGFPFYVQVGVLNNALPISGGLLKFHALSNLPLPQVNADSSEYYFSGDTLIFNLDAMSFSEQRFFTFFYDSLVGFNLNDSVFFETWVIPNETDLLPLNNYRLIATRVLGSYDPNDKQCLSGSYFTPVQLANNEEIEYLIRFQNFGNYYAQMVSITDTLSNFLDPFSLRIISSSHQVSASVIGSNVLRFTFPSICLPSIEQDSLLCNGYVAFALKLNNSVNQFDSVLNSADIYFDLNPSIRTNTVLTYIDFPPIVTALGESDINNEHLYLYPNPSNGMLNVRVSGENNLNRIVLMNTEGKVVANYEIPKGSKQTVLSLDLLPRGFYFVKVIKSDYSEEVFKLIKN